MNHQACIKHQALRNWVPRNSGKKLRNLAFPDSQFLMRGFLLGRGGCMLPGKGLARAARWRRRRRQAMAKWCLRRSQWRWTLGPFRDPDPWRDLQGPGPAPLASPQAPLSHGLAPPPPPACCPGQAWPGPGQAYCGKWCLINYK